MRPHHLDQEKCDCCNLCDEVCNRGIFNKVNDAMVFDPRDQCIGCGHCMAVCPQAALVRADQSLPPEILEDSMPSPDAFMHLLRARRSTRKFKPKIPPRSLLQKLVEAARYAPTGTNKQDVKVVVIWDPDRIETLREKIMARYGQYEGYLKNRMVRFFLKVFVDKRLGDPGIRAYLKQFMDRYRADQDPLFHRAPVVVLMYTGKEASTPKDDCCIALYHMVLMAERLGLGSCLLGTVEAAFAKTPALNDLVQIPRGSKVLTAACFGYPRLSFKRLVDRKPASVKWI